MVQTKVKINKRESVSPAAAVSSTLIVLSEAVTPQQVDAISWSHVEEDVLQVEQDGEEQRPLQVLGLYNRKTETTC